MYTPWHLFKVDFPGKVTSLKFSRYMFNIHAPFKFCGYSGLKIVHSVLYRETGKLSEGSCPFKIISHVSEALYKYFMLLWLCSYTTMRGGEFTLALATGMGLMQCVTKIISAMLSISCHALLMSKYLVHERVSKAEGAEPGVHPAHMQHMEKKPTQFSLKTHCICSRRFPWLGQS